MSLLRTFRVLVAVMLAVAPCAAVLARAEDGPELRLILDVGYGDVVTALALGGAVRPPPPPPSLKCPRKPGAYIVRTGTYGNEKSPDARNETPFCIVADLQGLTINFQLAEPFASLTPAKLPCTRLRANVNIVDVIARVGRAHGSTPVVVYDGGRAECGLDDGYAYALAVEKQGEPDFVAVRAGIASAATPTWSFSIPWTRLHLDSDAKSLLIVIGNAETVVPLRVIRANARFASVDYAPAVRADSSPAASGTASRIHEVELNASYNPDRHSLLATSFAQNQSTVAGQRALAQAVSLAPVSVPIAQTPVIIGQTLQTQSQPVFAFLPPSAYLEDQNLKGLFDVQPFAVTKVGSLASGYAYGYSNPTFRAAAFYGAQGPRSYTGAAMITVALATPAPSPEPTPRPTPLPPTLSNGYRPLEPPPPPAPFFESGTETTPPFQLSLEHGFAVGNGSRDTVSAIAFAGHVFNNAARNDADYLAQTVNVFGRLERDFHAPALAVSPSTTGRFIGESSSFTVARAGVAGTSFFQLRQVVAVQLDDPYLSPTAGTVTWLSALSGPIAHVTASLASGRDARFYALDLFGFRLTNVNGDLAAQEGLQVSVPLPLSRSGWLLSGGSATQTVSDRIAVVEQGLVPNYAAAVAQVVPTAAPGFAVAQAAKRTQRIGNVKINSPWFAISRKAGGAAQVQVVAGYNFGTVSECVGLAKSKPSAPTYTCGTVNDNRFVGGVFLKKGKFAFGATDTTVSSSTVSTTNAAHNLGTSGGLPGSTTLYATYNLCPQLSLAYTNAAFPSGVPLPQQGSTLSGQLAFPLTFGTQQFDLILGYFNEHSVASPAFRQSGFSAVTRLGTTFRKPASPGACNWSKTTEGP